MPDVKLGDAQSGKRTDDRRVAGTTWMRASAVAGVVFFVLIVVQSSLRSGAPSASDSGHDIVDYVVEHQGALQLGAALLGLAMAAALLFLPGLLVGVAVTAFLSLQRHVARWFAIASVLLALPSVARDLYAWLRRRRRADHRGERGGA